MDDYDYVPPPEFPRPALPDVYYPPISVRAGETLPAMSQGVQPGAVDEAIPEDEW